MNNKKQETFTRSDIESSLKKEFPNLTKQEISQAIDIILDSIVESVALDDKVEGNVKSITDFGIFVGLEGDIDGLIHLSDISEDDDPKEALDNYKKDQKLQCIVFAIDSDRERISLKLSE